MFNIISLCFEIVQAIALVIILLQLREIAQVLLFANTLETGVENPDEVDDVEDYTQGAESLADILNKRLKDEFGEDYERYLQTRNTHGKATSLSELENDFGITGCEIITDEDEAKK